MRARRDHWPRAAAAVIAAAALTAACGTTAQSSNAVSAHPAADSPGDAEVSSAPPAPSAAAPRAKRWTALESGDCLADPPPSDPGVVMVAVVDCATPHAAEVYARVPIVVNAAIANIADQQCAAGFSKYTGATSAAGHYTVGYLIDSEQDRTSDNPLPSSIICLLEDAGGGALTGSARR